jgi:hypothetical protein
MRGTGSLEGMASPVHGRSKGGNSSRLISRSLAKMGVEDPAEGLSTRMGGLLLTDKEALGLVIKGIEPRSVPRPSWAAVGKVCSPRKLVISALEQALHHAWGLHGTT